jgi:energy-coupling factor transport system ATP-binding protein
MPRAAISLQNVTYFYPATSTPALRDLSLDIPAGQFCAVAGANEAGKSTLAYLLAGFVPHFFKGRLAGSVTVAGQDTQAAELSQLVQLVGLLMQNPVNQITGTRFTVREEIAFGLENLGVPRDAMLARIQASLDMVGIQDLADRSPLGLSGGQMQRVALASVLAMQPSILVLDEPAAQLDPVGSREVYAAVRALAVAQQVTVVAIEHKLERIAGFAERVIVLADGSVALDGPPDTVLADESLLRLGVGNTGYTLAARAAREAGAWPAERRLAVTLEQAVEGFRAGRQA